ncbi:MAG: NMD3-related protein [Candidatus Micrarchaeia archaeon]|jgi:nonsense-mediated mRNA decay protein 3
MEKICPKCGASSNNKEFIDSFCVDCIKIKLEPPKEIEVYLCKECNKFRINNIWVPFSLDLLEKEIKKQTKGDFDNMVLFFDEEKKIGELKYTVLVGDNVVEIKKSIEIDIHNDLCRDCSRLRGGYYEAIIQIRGEDANKIEKLSEKIKKLIIREGIFVSKTVNLKEGIDVFVSNKLKSIEILTELKLKFKRTRTLYGVKKSGLKKGMRSYRDTFLVRV